MRCLVTGGAGFIGSTLARRLIADGHDVVVIDNLSTGKRANVPERAVFVEADLSDARALKAIPSGRFDVAVHLAAQSSGAIGQANPYADMQANVGSTLLLSRWCLDTQVPRFLYASSMTVYGHGNREPVPESAPCRPISYYGASKLASENYLKLAADEGLSVTCFRFYSVYGRGQNLGNRYQGMASIYLAYLLDRVPVPVTGSLDRYRDLLHVDDAVDAMMRALAQPRMPSFVYNVGTGERTLVRDLLVKLIRAVGLPDDHPIEEQVGSTSDVFGSVADAALARHELGWTARVPLDKGLADMVAWANEAVA